MPLRRQTDRALAFTAARLLVRLIEAPSKRAERACQRWASISPRHREEILKTLATMKSLDALTAIGRSLGPPPISSPRPLCRERKSPATRRAAMSARIARESAFAERRAAPPSNFIVGGAHRDDGDEE